MQASEESVPDTGPYPCKSLSAKYSLDCWLQTRKEVSVARGDSEEGRVINVLKSNIVI